MTKEDLKEMVATFFSGNQSAFVKSFNENSNTEHLKASYFNRQMQGTVSLETGGYSKAYDFFKKYLEEKKKTDAILGFNAFGKNVPSNRQKKAYDFLKSHFGFDTETSYAIVGITVKAIERDDPYSILGKVSSLNEDLDKIDLTGRYMLLANLLVD